MALHPVHFPSSRRIQDLEFERVNNTVAQFEQIIDPLRTALICYNNGGALSSVTLLTADDQQSVNPYPNDMRHSDRLHIVVNQFQFNCGGSVGIADPLVYGLSRFYVNEAGVLSVVTTADTQIALVQCNFEAYKMQASECWNLHFDTPNPRLVSRDGNPQV